ncbi:hypothetical protein AVEN_188793-1 [Araneus ventricosus]|uniref:Uncharacterized protein n=1 Tax=Araneus ventricosus TaxID=182803 RepID=A0A4Y2BS46_ARAVE|nr:hypothetical protein AVEN_188793-1 [Araneus ventricosus]
MYGEHSPTSRITAKQERCFLEYSGKHEAQVTGKITLAQISNKSRQRITNNNSNSRNNSHQRLTADQLAKRTNLQRDSSNSADVQRRLSHLSNSRVLYLS